MDKEPAACYGDNSKEEEMNNNSQEGDPLFHQEPAEEDKDRSSYKSPLEILDKETPSGEPRMSKDADNGAAIVSGHAEEG
jgi:hypothetical protein